MRLCRQDILNKLKKNTRTNKPIIGVSVGAGISAKYAALGGADMILALNSGRFRQMGFSSLAGMMPYENCNRLVLDFGCREVIRVVKDIPVIFGLCASDPLIVLDDFIDKVNSLGFSGINNFPTVGIIDGNFRQALEESYMGYDYEIKAVKIASNKNILTVAFVFDAEQALKMVDAGADIICAHLGFTRGGILGVKSYLPLEDAASKAQDIFNAVNSYNSDIIKLVYGGPVKTPGDAEFLYNNTDAAGYIGGSSFERIPTEEAITHITEMFKSYHILSGKHFDNDKRYSYISLIIDFISTHYSEDIVFSKIAEELHLSRNYLSYLFKKEIGCTFETYLMKFRIKKAKEILCNEGGTISEVSEKVGFNDLAYFSKVFKKITGKCPTAYIKEKN
jgi:predicted TIM-barrel enzyme/AraC-like DNA-binding protein